ncbi:MAG TPA: hypothetical protein VFD41_08125 [Actinomycetales bacterium]|nr:hypothetical protein [Actinomycetales bacterium]
MDDQALLRARACVVADLVARRLDAPAHVDLVDDVVASRRWWLEQWPEGAEHVAGQIAQDVQDAMAEAAGVRWPACLACADEVVHELRITPDLGPDPRWVCETSGADAGPLGSL